MNKQNRKLEVPGAPAETPPAPSAPVDPALPAAAPVAPDPSEDQARTDASAAQVAATKHLVGSDQALDWSHLSQPATILSKINHNPDDDLPAVESIDWAAQPKNVTRILTRQGWLLRP